MIEFSKRLVIAFVLLLIAAGAQAQDILESNSGYSIWERSIEKPILKILRKYGIK